VHFRHKFAPFRLLNSLTANKFTCLSSIKRMFPYYIYISHCLANRFIARNSAAVWGVCKFFLGGIPPPHKNMPVINTECTRGDQKVLQLHYKTLTYYMTHAVIFDIFSCNISAYFQLLLSAVYALKIEFSVLILRPCFYSDLQ